MTNAQAERIAEDIWTGREIRDEADVKWYLAEECSNHPMPEYVEDAVYALLVGRLAR
jgi:hypothetical protein